MNDKDPPFDDLSEEDQEIWDSYTDDFTPKVDNESEEENFEEVRYQDKHFFLWGKNILYSEYGAILSYEILHDLFVNMSFNKIDISAEQDDNSFIESSNSYFIFSIGYGF